MALFYGVIRLALVSIERILVLSTTGMLNLVIVFATGTFSRFLAGMAFACTTCLLCSLYVLEAKATNLALAAWLEKRSIVFMPMHSNGGWRIE